MTKKPPKPETAEPDDNGTPSWVTSPDRATPYTEEELDLLVEGTLEGIRDTAAWTDLVDRVGEEEARRELRSRIIMGDEIAGKLPRH
jgi:hypothetical protein